MLMVFHYVYHLCDYLEQTEVPGIMMTLLHLTKYLIKKITPRKASLQGWQTDQRLSGWGGWGRFDCDLRGSGADGIVLHSVCGGGPTNLCQC